jgi:DNA-binding beta-propeller fold protein YncE
MGPNGTRLAQETLAINHTVNTYQPIGWDDVKGQFVRVFDAANGKVALETPTSPVLDSGGNVAISPSGRRVAVLNAGAIQVFDLPEPPPLTDTDGNQAGH